MRASFLIRAKFLCLIFITFHIITHHISRPELRVIRCETSSTVKVIARAETSLNTSDTQQSNADQAIQITPVIKLSSERKWSQAPSSTRPQTTTTASAYTTTTATAATTTTTTTNTTTTNNDNNINNSDDNNNKDDTIIKSNIKEANSNVTKKQAETDDQIYAADYWPKFNSSSNELDVRDYLSVQKIETNQLAGSPLATIAGADGRDETADARARANEEEEENGSGSGGGNDEQIDEYEGQSLPPEYVGSDVAAATDSSLIITTTITTTATATTTTTTNNNNTSNSTLTQCINKSDVDLPPKFVRIGFTGLYAFILPFGLFGNLLTLYVMLRKKTSISILDIFIANLAISDILLCAFSVPIAPINSLHYGYWVFGRTFCFIYSFTMSSSVYSSTLTMIFIGFYRYQLIVNAHKNNMTKMHAYACCSFAWLLGIVVATPFTFNVDIEPSICEVSFCGENWDLPMSRFRFSMATLVLQFFVPLISTSYFYGSIYFTLSKQERVKYGWNRKIDEQQQQEQHEDEERHKRTKMLAVTQSNSAHQFQQIALTPDPVKAKGLHRLSQMFVAKKRNSESALKCQPAQITPLTSQKPAREAKMSDVNKRRRYRLRMKSPLGKSCFRNSASKSQNTSPDVLDSNGVDSIKQQQQQSLGPELTSPNTVGARTHSSVKVTIIENDTEQQQHRQCCRLDEMPNGQPASRYVGPTPIEAPSGADCEPSERLSELTTNLQTNQTPIPQNIVFVDTISLEVGTDRNPRFPSQQSLVNQQHQLKRATSDLTTRRLSLIQQMPPTLGVCSSAGSTSHLARYKRHNGNEAIRRLLPEFRFNREQQLRQRNRRIRQTNKKLLAVIALFVASWLPLNIYNSVIDFMEIEQESIETRLLFIVAQTCASVSVCYNPLLYAWMSENYRQELANVLPTKMRLLLRIQSPSEIP